MKKVHVFALIYIFSIMFTAATFAADKATGASQVKDASVASKIEAGRKPEESRSAFKPNYLMLSGAISNIDSTDPNKVKIEIKSDRDDQIHTVEVTPATNITKATEVSELKVGETIRVMARKVADKEVAMGIMHGKLKKLPAPPKTSPAQATPELKAPGSAAKTKK